MEQLRRRVPFNSKDEDEEPEHVLDEQEQDELIQSLRVANASSDRKALLTLYAILGMSLLAHLLVFTPLTLLPILAHSNLLLILRQHPTAFSFPITYATACVAPTLALFLGYPVLWWLLTPGVVFVVQNVLDSMDKSTEHLSALEGMKYRSLGA